MNKRPTSEDPNPPPPRRQRQGSFELQIVIGQAQIAAATQSISPTPQLRSPRELPLASFSAPASPPRGSFRPLDAELLAEQTQASPSTAPTFRPRSDTESIWSARSVSASASPVWVDYSSDTGASTLSTHPRYDARVPGNPNARRTQSDYAQVPSTPNP